MTDGWLRQEVVGLYFTADRQPIRIMNLVMEYVPQTLRRCLGPSLALALVMEYVPQTLRKCRCCFRCQMLWEEGGGGVGEGQMGQFGRVGVRSETTCPTGCCTCRSTRQVALVAFVCCSVLSFLAKRDMRMKESRVRLYMFQLARALLFMHSHQVWHAIDNEK